MNKIWKRLFSLLLTVLLISNQALPALARGNAGSGLEGTDTGTGLEFIDADVSGYNPGYIGEVYDDSNKGDLVKEGEKLPYDEDEIVRVSIVLEKPSTFDAGFELEDIAENKQAIAYRDSLKREQASLTKTIEKAIDANLDVKWNITLLLNVISADVRYGDIETIKSVKGVKDVRIEREYEPTVADQNTAVSAQEMVFAANAWESGYTGAGSRVAIIDTGVNDAHISFQADAFEYSLTKDGKSLDDYGLLTLEELQGVASQLNRSINPGSAYINSKIPFAYNYRDNNYNTDHFSDSQGNHGSHVAGIAAANRYINVNGEFADAATEKFAVGVAPDAQILVMKVFGAGGGAYPSDYFVAIEDAIILKADTVNLSLGSGNPGLAFDSMYQNVLDKLTASGTVSAISAGNAYGWHSNLPAHEGLYVEDVSMDTTGEPGSLNESLGVAAAQNIGSVGTPLIFNGEQAAFYTETDSTGAKMASIAGTYDYVYIDGVGEFDEYDTVNAQLSLNGKIVLVNRGSISFYVKGNNAIRFSPAAVVIVNNQPGTINMDLSDYTGTFPMVAITLAAGQKLKESEAYTAGNYTYYTGTVEVTDVIQSAVTTDIADAEITDFSSWGVPGSLTLKPEITAPGGDIWSVDGMTSDGYTSMGGTSMAAPHVAGMAAVVAQYIRDNDLMNETVVAESGLTQRGLINSLLMSTATSMWADDELILPVLKQGSGLGNVFAAVQAKSFITMSEDSVLAASSAKDGKVKAELGQDAQRNGEYTFGFTIHNMSDDDLTYELSTDGFFSQDVFEGSDGKMYLDEVTVKFDTEDAYEWEKPAVAGHDVDKDGDTDTDDAQAILDYLTGNREEADTDLEAAEMGDDEEVTSRDAYLLLAWLEEQGNLDDVLVVPAHDSIDVTVTLTLSDAAKEEMDATYPNGAYLEAFTNIECTSLTDDGAEMDVKYSIPVLGYYGSWTEPSMFEASMLDYAYEGRAPYLISLSGAYTSYITVKQNGTNTMYTGNPYTIEDEFPYDRLALNSASTLVNANYLLIRNAATTVPMILSEDYEILWSGSEVNEQYGAWYYVNGSAWQDYTASTERINVTPADLGLAEGDKFTFGMFAVPEYYALALDNETKSGAVAKEDIAKLLKDGELGKGSYIGNTVTIDNKAPEITSVTMDENGSIQINLKDDNYVAYVAVMDVSGLVTYAGAAPGAQEPGVEFSVSFGLGGTDLGNAVAVFAGDYAANETVQLVRLNDGPITVKKPYWKLTDSLQDQADYIIANINKAGTAKVLNSQGTNALTNTVDVAVLESEELGAYIPADAVDNLFVWTYNATTQNLQNAGDGGYLGYYRSRQPMANWAAQSNGDAFTYTGTTLYVNGSTPTSYSNGYYMYPGSTSVPTYLYTMDYYDEELDPDNATEVIVDPSVVTLILDISPTAALTYSIAPVVLDDKTVTWTSSDETVATVDQEGLVTAVGVGTATIRATSNKTPTVYGECLVNVADSNPMDATINAQVAYGSSDVRFVSVDLNDMSVTNLGPGTSALYGGGRSGSKIWGNDSANTVYEFDLENDYAATNLFTMNASYAFLDGASFPSFPATFNDTAYEVVYDCIAVSPSGYFQMMIMSEGSLSYFNFSEDLGKLVAVTFAGLGETDEGQLELWYYALNQDGMLYVIGVYPSGVSDGEVDLGAEFGEVGPVGVLSMAGSEKDYSMSYLYDAETEVEYIFIADNTVKGIFCMTLDSVANETKFVGKLDGATNISTLYNDAYDSVGSLMLTPAQKERIDSIMSESSKTFTAQKVQFAEPKAEEIAEPAEEPAAEEVLAEEPAEEIAEEFTAEEPAAEEAIAEETAEEEIPAVETAEETEEAEEEVPAGGLQAFHGGSPKNTFVHAKAAAEAAEDEPKITVSEDEDSNNGFITVEYDTEKLTLVSAVSDLKFNSVNSEEEGTVKFSYAQLEAIKSGEALLTLTFESECEDQEVTISVTERNDELGLTETLTAAVNGEGHAWGEPVWTWAEDYSSAKATFTCGNDETHVEEVEAKVEVSVDEEGNTVYTATVEFEGETYTDQKVVEAETYPLEVNDPENGTVTVEPEKDGYKAGEEVTLTVTPDEGYELGEVLVNGEPVEVGEDGTVKITVEGDTKVEVTFQAAEYKFIEGMGQTWTKGSKDGAFFKTDGAFSIFAGLYVDGKLLTPDQYEAKEGSTEITLKAEYLETLAEGEHTLTAQYGNGSEPETTFKVAKKSEQPGTGTKGMSSLWYVLAGLGAAAFVVLRKKEETEE